MIHMIPALFLFFLGWLVRYRKATWLISGYNTSSKKKKEEYDIDKLTYYMGNFMFILAGVFVVISILSILFSQHTVAISLLGYAAASVIMVAGLIFLNTGGRIMKSDSVK